MVFMFMGSCSFDVSTTWPSTPRLTLRAQKMQLGMTLCKGMLERYQMNSFKRLYSNDFHPSIHGKP